MIEFRTDIARHTAVITLDRPEARNAIDPTTAKQIEASLDAFEDDPRLRVAIIAARGPAFCAGADLKAVNAGLVHELNTERGGFAGLTQRVRSKPLIAAVDGPALAGGCEIVLACDLVVASRTATFGLPEVKRSLVAAAGGLFRLGRRVPLNVAMHCALTGEPLDAERAFQYGLVTTLTEPGEALTGALAVADQIAANAPLAVALSRQLVGETTLAPDDVAWQRSAEALQAVERSDDFREGVSAFLEKRPPEWTGR